MNLQRIISIDDLRRAARRELPKIIFDFVEGGVEDELGLATNARIGQDHQLIPRYFGKVGAIDRSVSLMGQDYAEPFGIAPTGLASLFRPGADLILARAAADAKIPFVLSTASNASLEEVAEVAGEYAWFQLYGALDRSITADMIRRADAAGYRTLVVTVDTPGHAKRERNMRNGFAMPPQMSLPVVLEALRHPRWVYRYLRQGSLTMKNWAPYAAENAKGADVIALSMTQVPTRESWADLETTRRLWPHKLVVKGVMHPDDATMAVNIGAEGVIVSNHGGRVFDRAPSSFAVLPYVRDAVADRAAVMLDSGIMRGSDIITAYCLGADFVFVGRATLYGAIVGGLDGTRRAIEILQQEIAILLGQMGCATPVNLGRHYLISSLEVSKPL